MNPHIIIQARMNSTRLPRKVMLDILGKPVLQHCVERCQQTGLPVGVATTKDSVEIIHWCEEHGVKYFLGSMGDVLDRMYHAAIEWQADPVIRVTSDCPLVDPELITRVLEAFKKTLKPVGNYFQRTKYLVSVAAGEGARGLKRYPDGMDVEVICFAALGMAWLYAHELYDREHVTPWIWREHKDKCLFVENTEDRGGEKLSIDTWNDFDFVRRIIERQGDSVQRGSVG